MDEMMKAFSKREKKALLALGLKRCTVCGKIKALTKYANNKAAPDGKMPRCKVCTSAYMRARYEAIKEALQEEAQEEKERRKQISRGSLKTRQAARARRNARIARASDGTITKAAIKEMLTFCNHTCMWPECTETKDLTIDHVIPLLKKTGKKGAHSIKNIQILCRRHNSQKGRTVTMDLRPPEWPWR